MNPTATPVLGHISDKPKGRIAYHSAAYSKPTIAPAQHNAAANPCHHRPRHSPSTPPPDPSPPHLP